jgi:hypothetical protein
MVFTRFLIYRLETSACLLSSSLVSDSPVILLFSLRDALVLHRLPLYYERPTYYCFGSVVKSPVLYFSSRHNPVLYSLIRVAVS